MRRSFFLAAAAMAMVGLTTPAFAQSNNNDRERRQDAQNQAVERQIRIQADLDKADLDRELARREARIKRSDSDLQLRIDQLRLADRDEQARDLQRRANDNQRDANQRLNEFKRNATRQINDRLDRQLDFLKQADKDNRNVSARSFGSTRDLGRNRFVDFGSRDNDRSGFRFASRNGRNRDLGSRDNDRFDFDFSFMSRDGRARDASNRDRNRSDFRFTSRDRRERDRDVSRNDFFRNMDTRRRSVRVSDDMFSDDIFGFGPRRDVSSLDRDDSRIFRGFSLDREFRTRDNDRRSFDLSDLFDRDNRRGRDARTSNRRDRNQLSTRDLARQIRELGDDLNARIGGRRGDQIEAQLDRFADQLSRGRSNTRDIRNVGRRGFDNDSGRRNRDFGGSRNDFFNGRRVSSSRVF